MSNTFWFGLEPNRDIPYLVCWGARATNYYGKLDILPDRQSHDKYSEETKDYWKALQNSWNNSIKNKVNECLGETRNDTRLNWAEEGEAPDYKDRISFLDDTKVNGQHVLITFIIKNGQNGYIYICGYVVDIDEHIAYEEEHGVIG